MSVVISWSEDEPEQTVANGPELIRTLQEIEQRVSNRWPVIVTLVRSEDEDYLDICLGASRSALHHIPPGGDPPYSLTLGDPELTGEVDFFLFTHHTPRLESNMIPREDAFRGVEWWADHGGLAPFLTWEDL